MPDHLPPSWGGSTQIAPGLAILAPIPVVPFPCFDFTS